VCRVRHAVERIVLAAAVPVGVLLDASAALVQRVAGQTDDVEGIHDRDSVGQLFAGGGLEPGEPVHRDDLHAAQQTGNLFSGEVDALMAILQRRGGSIVTGAASLNAHINPPDRRSNVATRAHRA